MTPRPNTALIMAPSTFQQQFGTAEIDRLRSLATLEEPFVLSSLADLTPERRERTEVLLTSWGCPSFSDEDLATLPALRGILHAAGSVRHLVPASAYERGLVITSAADRNAVPVAEYTLAAIILAGKRALPLAQRARREAIGWSDSFALTDLSNYGRTVGIIGFSRIGRRVVELLRVLDVAEVLVTDPVADPAEIRAAGATPVELTTLLERSDIVSLHAPLLPSTHHLLGAAELALLHDGATLVNTGRGGLLDHEALLVECASGRLDAILDVTDPEPLPVGHPLLALENVTVTPHLAGSLGTETRRLSQAAIDALEALTLGAVVPGAVPRESVEMTA